MTRRFLLALLGVAALSAAAGAHHSATMFEQTRTITVEGVVKEFQYTNPHSWLLIDVTGKDGKVTTWGFEAEGPTTLMQRKVRRSDFAPGTKMTFAGINKPEDRANLMLYLRSLSDSPAPLPE